MKLPSFIASTPPPRSSGLVRADVGAMSPKAPNTGELQALSRIGGAISQAGKFAEQAYLQKRELDDIGTMGESDIKAGDAVNEGIRNINTPDLGDGTDLDNNIAHLDSTKKSYGNQINEYASKIRNPKTKAKWISQRLIDGNAQIERTNNRKFNDAQVTKFRGLAENFASQGDLETANMYIDKLEELGRIYPSAAAEYKADNAKTVNDYEMDTTFEMAIATGSKESGYEMVGNADFTADETRVLDNKIEDYWANRDTAAKKAEKQSTHQTYADFSDQIDKGELNYDKIDLSKLSKDDKELWQEYLKGSHVEPATLNTPKAHKQTVGAVLDSMTLEMSPKEAYDVLLNEYYGEHSITKEQFEWSLDKITNPYPKELIPDIRRVLNNVRLEGFDMWNAKGKMKANEDLLNWVDALIKQDKVPLFDFGKKLDAMSTYYMWGREDYLRDIGDISEVGGRKWEIIGYNNDGEPIVEEYDPYNPFIPDVDMGAE